MDLMECDTAGDNSNSSREMLPGSQPNNFYFGDFSVSNVQRPNLISNFETQQQQQFLAGGGGGGGGLYQRPHLVNNSSSAAIAHHHQQSQADGSTRDHNELVNKGSPNSLSILNSRQLAVVDASQHLPLSSSSSSVVAAAQSAAAALVVGRASVNQQQQGTATMKPQVQPQSSQQAVQQQHVQSSVHPHSSSSGATSANLPHLRRSPVPRQYFDSTSVANSAAAAQHQVSDFNSLPVARNHVAETNKSVTQQQMQMAAEQQLFFDDLFPATSSASTLGLMQPRQPGAPDHRYVDYAQQHAPRPQFMMESGATSYQPQPPALDFMYGEPNWDEMWGLDSSNSLYQGHPLAHHRSSLSHDGLMFQQRAPPSASAAPSGYMTTQQAFDVSRRPQRVRQDARAWIPSSQLQYDASSMGMVAPPRTVGPRQTSLTPAAPPSMSRKSLGFSRFDGEQQADGEKKKAKVTHSPMAGENRLKITFVSLGTPGEAAQHFGTKGYIIPDGVSGMHQVYHQRWRFDIKHRKIEDTICVSWSITNLASGTACERTETPREAKVRETSGHTICNQLLRQALKVRASELEMQLNSLRDNPTKFSNTENLIKALRPKSCILGLLFFGLLHDTVQQRMRDMLGITQPIHGGVQHDDSAASARGYSQMGLGSMPFNESGAMLEDHQNNRVAGAESADGRELDGHANREEVKSSSESQSPSVGSDSAAS